eukprot:GHVP01031458.1.p1 GENE.GHVP01031458.1~~GHVP01031458.1.p1  ORF type:complete len:290 (-),score=30.45 GHVP01031458.1:912-1781(-)
MTYIFLTENEIEHLQQIDSEKVEEIRSEILRFNAKTLDNTLLGRLVFHKNRYFCEDINNLFVIGQITEISGESQTYKSRLLTQLTVFLSLSEICFRFSSACSFYISTDRLFRSDVLENIHSNLSKIHSSIKDGSVGSNLYVSDILTQEDFLEFVYKRLPRILRYNKNIKIIIIDSITSNFRGSSIKDYSHIAIYLKEIAVKYEVAIVCSNQVSAIISDENSFETSKMKPALNYSWQNNINNRVFIKIGSNGKRKMTILKGGPTQSVYSLYLEDGLLYIKNSDPLVNVNY